MKQASFQGSAFGTHTGQQGSINTHTHTHTHTHIPSSLNRAKRRSRNCKVVGSIPGAGMSGGGRRQPCVKGILSGEIAK